MFEEYLYPNISNNASQSKQMRRGKIIPVDNSS